MAGAEIDISTLVAKGHGYCAGGQHPDPPLDRYPLLCWTALHDRFGPMVVHLEDQRASVHDVALAFAETGTLDGAAARFGTTQDHAEQAIRYADEWRRLNAS